MLQFSHKKSVHRDAHFVSIIVPLVGLRVSLQNRNIAAFVNPSIEWAEKFASNLVRLLLRRIFEFNLTASTTYTASTTPSLGNSI